MSRAEDIFEKAFSVPRDPRSAEYKSGVLAILFFRLGDRKDRVRCPYEIGTASADAWCAGCDYGHRLAREELMPNKEIYGKREEDNGK